MILCLLESSVHVEEQKTGIVSKSKLKGNHSTAGVKVVSPKTTKGKVSSRDASPIAKVKDAAHQSNAGIQKRRKKSLPSKVRNN